MVEEESRNSTGDRLWWFCLKHNRPELGPGCPGKQRLGPYPSEETAARALETVAQRNEAWDEDGKG